MQAMYPNSTYWDEEQLSLIGGFQSHKSSLIGLLYLDTRSYTELYSIYIFQTWYYTV